MPSKSQQPTRQSGRSRQAGQRPTEATIPDRSDLAAYIANLAAELVSLARVADLRTLAYLTDMVRLEAEHQLAVLRAPEEAAACVQMSDTRPAESR